jgi:hypothetical protein
MNRHRSHRRRTSLIALIVTVVVFGAAGTAFAVWNASTNVNVTGTGATLATPTNFGATSNAATTANLSWTAPTNATSYTLSQSPGTLAGCSATPGLSPTSCTATSLTPGTSYTWTLKAVFHNWVSAAVTTSLTPTKATPTIAVTHFPTSPTLGQSVTFTATVTGPTNWPTPTGTVTWDLSLGQITTCASTTPISGSGNTATATCTITASKAGGYNAKASVGLDTNYNAAGPSTADTFTVAKATATNTVTPSINPSTTGTAVTYTATVTGPSGGATPTGSVTFKDGGNAITTCGSSGVVNLDGSGVATCTVTYASTAGSPHSITAPYSGDLNYNAAAGNTVSETVNAVLAKFAVSAPSTATAGTAFTVTLTAQDAGGATVTSYTGPQCVTFSGPSNSPSGATPTYPVKGSCASGSEVTFSNGVATGVNAPSITLTDAQTTTLTVTDNPTSKTGTSGNIVVSAGAAADLAFTSITFTSQNFASAPSCLFGCTITGAGNSPSWSAKVSVTDANGNIEQNLASVTLTYTATGTSGWTNGSTTTSASGAATTSTPFTFSHGTSNYSTTMKVTGSSFGSVQVQISK